MLKFTLSLLGITLFLNASAYAVVSVNPDRGTYTVDRFGSKRGR